MPKCLNCGHITFKAYDGRCADCEIVRLKNELSQARKESDDLRSQKASIDSEKKALDAKYDVLFDEYAKLREKYDRTVFKLHQAKNDDPSIQFDFKEKSSSESTTSNIKRRRHDVQSIVSANQTVQTGDCVVGSNQTSKENATTTSEDSNTNNNNTSSLQETSNKKQKEIDESKYLEILKKGFQNVSQLANSSAYLFKFANMASSGFCGTISVDKDTLESLGNPPAEHIYTRDMDAYLINFGDLKTLSSLLTIECYKSVQTGCTAATDITDAVNAINNDNLDGILSDREAMVAVSHIAIQGINTYQKYKQKLDDVMKGK